MKFGMLIEYDKCYHNKLYHQDKLLLHYTDKNQDKFLSLIFLSVILTICLAFINGNSKIHVLSLMECRQFNKKETRALLWEHSLHKSISFIEHFQRKFADWVCKIVLITIKMLNVSYGSFLWINLIGFQNPKYNWVRYLLMAARYC